jgi:hypothetical protein
LQVSPALVHIELFIGAIAGQVAHCHDAPVVPRVHVHEVVPYVQVFWPPILRVHIALFAG